MYIYIIQEAGESFVFYRKGNLLEKESEPETMMELEYLQAVIKDRENEKRNTNVLQELCK